MSCYHRFPLFNYLLRILPRHYAVVDASVVMIHDNSVTPSRRFKFFLLYLESLYLFFHWFTNLQSLSQFYRGCSCASFDTFSTVFDRTQGSYNLMKWQDLGLVHISVFTRIICQILVPLMSLWYQTCALPCCIECGLTLYQSAVVET